VDLHYLFLIMEDCHADNRLAVTYTTCFLEPSSLYASRQFDILELTEN